MAYPYNQLQYGGAVPGIGGGAGFGAVPGVAQASNQGVSLQANNAYGGATIQVPGQAPQQSFASVPAPADAQLGGGSSASPYSAYIPSATFLGKNYDLSDAGQRMAYFNDNAANLHNQYQQSISQLDRDNYNENLRNAAVSNQENLGQLRQGQFNVHNDQGTGQADQYARQLTRQIADLYNGYGTGLSNVHHTYLSLSPNAYQSSEGQDAQYAQSQYQKGNSDLQNQAQSTVGSHFLQDGTLDPNSQLGQQYAGYGRQIGDLQRLYDQYLGDQGNALALARQSASNAVGTGEDQIATQLGTYDKFQKVPIQGYAVQTPQNSVQGNQQLQAYQPGSVQTYQPYQLPSVDISQYSPFANAGQLAASPGSTFGGAVGASGTFGGGNPTGLPQQTPLQQGLGYTPGSIQGSYAQQYLKGGALIAGA